MKMVVHTESESPPFQMVSFNVQNSVNPSDSGQFDSITSLIPSSSMYHEEPPPEFTKRSSEHHLKHQSTQANLAHRPKLFLHHPEHRSRHFETKRSHPELGSPELTRPPSASSEAELRSSIETFRPLKKSLSSNQISLNYSRNNVRSWRNSSSLSRPMVLEGPAFSSQQSVVTVNQCCKCHGERSESLGKHGLGMSHQQSMTPEGLSWRRLHMSRAKLKATATTSELLSGFAMVAMVELQINVPTSVPEWLFVMFSVCTTVLVAVHIFALMISTYLLPNIDAVSKLQIAGLVSESPHERMRGFIELAWAFSTVLGLFLFLVEVAILCWVKFWDYSFTAAWAATIIVVPVLVVFVAFAVHFYHNLMAHKCDSSDSDLHELEMISKKLDTQSPV